MLRWQRLKPVVRNARVAKPLATATFAHSQTLAHTLISPSSPADSRALPSKFHLMVMTAPVCAGTFLSSRAVVGAVRFHTLHVPSVHEHAKRLAARFPMSGLHAIDVTYASISATLPVVGKGG